MKTGLAAVRRVPVIMAATCPSSVNLSFAMNFTISEITNPIAARCVVPGEISFRGGFKWFITNQHGSKIRHDRIEINNVKRITKTSSEYHSDYSRPSYFSSLFGHRFSIIGYSIINKYLSSPSYSEQALLSSLLIQ